MAIPIWVPFALMAASAAANYKGQKETEKAQGQAWDNFKNRLDEEDRKANATLQKTMQEYTDVPERAEETGTDLADAMKAEQSYSADLPVQQAVNNTVDTTDPGTVVNDWGRQRRQESKRFNEGLSDALGDLRGVEQEMFDSGLAARGYGIDLAGIAGNRRGANRVFNQYMLAAPEAGQAWGTAGDVLALAAMVTGPAAMAQTGGQAATTAASAGGPGSMAASTPVTEMATEAALMSQPTVAMSPVVQSQLQPTWWQKALNTAQYYGSKL
ncbi:MAG: hypothetical protein ACPG1A_07500 [Halioglobus sp.]